MRTFDMQRDWPGPANFFASDPRLAGRGCPAGSRTEAQSDFMAVRRRRERREDFL